MKKKVVIGIVFTLDILLASMLLIVSIMIRKGMDKNRLETNDIGNHFVNNNDHQTENIANNEKEIKDDSKEKEPEENKTEEENKQVNEETEKQQKEEIENQPQENNKEETIVTPSEPVDKPIENQPVTPPVEITQEMKNDQKRKTINSTYGIHVLYGEEIGNYKPRGYTPVKMTDTKRIQEYLERLNKTLAYYPNGFFQEFKNQGMPLTIYLVESVPGNAFTGLTDKEFYDDVKITITTTGFFERIINHELMHYIDMYLEIVMYPDSVENAWNALNPSGYRYGSFNENYNYHMINRPKGAYFINNYAQTNYLEDRASTFEDMMSRAYAPTGCYDQGEVIRQKGALIASQIEKYFKTVSPGVKERWERFVK